MIWLIVVAVETFWSRTTLSSKESTDWEETENSEIVLEWRMDLRVLNPLRETTEQSRVNKENSSKLTKLNTSFSLPQIFTMPVTAFQTLVKVNQQVRVSIRIYLITCA